ncbi:hypothetical protein D3C81_1162140 [compost metagenome]
MPVAPRVPWIAPTLLFSSVILDDWLVFTPSAAVTRLLSASTTEADALVASPLLALLTEFSRVVVRAATLLSVEPC